MHYIGLFKYYGMLQEGFKLVQFCSLRLRRFSQRRHKKTRLYRRVEWQRPIFPGDPSPSIVGAEGLNGRVRDGNGCFPFAIVTTPPACTCGWISFSYWWR
jgi:hypothetical protein